MSRISRARATFRQREDKHIRSTHRYRLMADEVARAQMTVEHGRMVGELMDPEWHGD
jgi:hypothetical protein